MAFGTTPQMETNEIPSAYTQLFQALHLPGTNQRLEKLLMWRDPVKSGGVLAASCAVYWVLGQWEIPLITVICHLCAFVIASCLAWSRASVFLGRPELPIPKILAEGISEQQFRKVSEKVYTRLNKVLAVTHTIILGKDLKTALKLKVFFVVAGILFNRFSLLKVGFIAIVLAFTVPKLYELNKTEVDKFVEKLQKKIEDARKRFDAVVMSKIPKASDAASSVPLSTAGMHEGMKKME